MLCNLQGGARLADDLGCATDLLTYDVVPLKATAGRVDVTVTSESWDSSDKKGKDKLGKLHGCLVG